ncbi:hypothetical protein ACLOJK_003995 [Asimina triloba]
MTGEDGSSCWLAVMGLSLKLERRKLADLFICLGLLGDGDLVRLHHLRHRSVEMQLMVGTNLSIDGCRQPTLSRQPWTYIWGRWSTQYGALVV